MLPNNKLELLNYLLEVGCCKNCCLRYLCDKSLDFSEPEAYLKQHDLLNWYEDERYENGEEKKEQEEGQKCKRIKNNPCIVCLGLLQNFSIESILENEQLNTAEKYDTNVFTCSISMPACILIRERSIRLMVESKYPLLFAQDENNPEIPLNRVWKMFVKKPLEKRLNKVFENSDICAFSINIVMSYEDDEEELQVLKEMQPQMYKDREIKHRKYNGEMHSRKGTMNVLALTTTTVFTKHAKIPPEIPSKGITCKTIECKHEPIFFAGRYCKFSRNLSQTPWLIDGVKTMETSVQEIMFENINKIAHVPLESLVFSSSGREDCDVRCLDKGRPFYIEVLDPKKTNFTFQDFREMENAINTSPLIKVTDLQLVKRGDLTKIKEGEEFKTKTYVALCVLRNFEVNEEHLNKINAVGKLTIKQKTPIRVLHRRPVAVREREIHELSASKVPGHPNLFTLIIKTQAGTYVKEFVHGDFGRTKPNIGEILNTDVDIIALDVTSIDLDWPQPINYQTLDK